MKKLLLKVVLWAISADPAAVRLAIKPSPPPHDAKGFDAIASG